MSTTTARVEELLRAHDIHLRDARPGNHATTCPHCSAGRKKKGTRCLGVKIDDEGVCWSCAHCGWSGPPRGNGRDDDYRATHDYHDAEGRYLYTKVRYPRGHDPKCRLRRRNGNGGWLGWGTGGAPRVLYRLPEVLTAIAAGKTIAVAEGESDADALWAVGIPATCSRDGAPPVTPEKPSPKSKWLAEDSEQLRGANIVVLGDHDPPGHFHQDATALACVGVARRVRVLRLADHWSECPEGGDVSDWLAAGHAAEELLALMAAAPDLEAPTDGPAPEPEPRRASSLIIRPMSSYEMQPVEWLWPNRFPVGALSLVVGDPEEGKSLTMADVEARVTRGGDWPNGEGAAPRGSVIVLAAEDDVARTMRPRLEAAGGDPSKVQVVEAVHVQNRTRGFNLAEDVARLGAAIDEIGDARLVRFDPLTAYLGKPGGLDSYRESDVRALLTPLAKLAEQRRVAMFGVMHLAKNLTAKAVLAAIGSIAFSAAARSIYLAVPDPDAPGRRLFLKAKNNLAPNMPGLSYTIEVRQVTENIAAPVVVWGSEPVIVTADEALRASRGGSSSSQARAVLWLRAALAGGPRSAAALKQEAEAAGFTEKILRAAREKLGVRSAKGTGKNTAYMWSLPEEAPQDDLPF